MIKSKLDVRGKEVKSQTLLNMSWSDGDFFEAGTRHDIFTDEEKRNLTFHNHVWLGGDVVVSYKGEIIYITYGWSINQSLANQIKRAIQTGYTQDPALLED